MTGDAPGRPATQPTCAPSTVLVVGGGLAGFHVAHALRRQGFVGEITVAGAEAHLPYDRPPLSKAFLAGDLQPADLALDDAADPLEVTWRPGTVAAELLVELPVESAVGSAPSRVVGVRTSQGEELRADAVVVATGADAVRIGPDAPGAHVLRTLDDAVRLRDDHPAGRRVVVVGTGFVGLEAASVAVQLGAASVAVVGLEAVPLAERLGPEVGHAVRALHERHSVRFLTDTPVRGLALRDGRAVGVHVDAKHAGPDHHPAADDLLDVDADGRTVVPADLVVVGIGARPATAWLAPQAEALGLALGRDGGVLCDPTGRTGVPGLWAMGDCARWQHPDQEGHRVAGHWQDALDQAVVVATDLVGAEAAAAPAPYFWSDQHGVRIQLAGHLTGQETPVVRAGSTETADLLVAYERDGVPVALLAMDRPREVMRWRREHRAGAHRLPAVHAGARAAARTTDRTTAPTIHDLRSAAS